MAIIPSGTTYGYHYGQLNKYSITAYTRNKHEALYAPHTYAWGQRSKRNAKLTMKTANHNRWLRYKVYNQTRHRAVKR